MNRNLILFSVLIVFLIGLYAINNWVSIINVPKAKNVYMNNKEKKIKMVKIFHKAAKESYIFSKMMENNKDGLINAVIKNHAKFWEVNNNSGIFEGFDSKFDALVQSIIKDNNLNIDYKGSDKLGKGKYAEKKTQLYQLSFRCEYEDLLVFISETFTPSSSPVPLIVIVAALMPVPVDRMEAFDARSIPSSLLEVPTIWILPSTELTVKLSFRWTPSSNALPVIVMVAVPVWSA